MRRHVVLAAGAALGLLALAANAESDLLALAALLLLGAALAVGYRTSFAQVLRFARPPRPAEGVLAVTSFVAAVLTAAVVGSLASGPWPSSVPPGEHTLRFFRWLVVLAAAGLPTAPLVIGAVRRNPTSEAPPVWPAAAGLAGGGLAALAVLVLWSAAVDPWFRGEASAAEVLVWPFGLALTGLFIGLGLGGWTRAVQGTAGAAFNSRGLFRSALAGAGLLLSLGVLLGATVALTPRAGAGAGGADLGLVSGGVLVAGVGAAWLACFWRVHAVEPASWWRGVLAVAVLVVGLPLTLAAPGSLGGAREWAALFVVLVGPVSLAFAVAVAAVGPALLRRILLGAAARDA